MKTNIRSRIYQISILILFTGFSSIVSAGNLEPSGPPAPTMKTLDEVMPTWSQKLDDDIRFVLVMDDQAVLDKETGLVWARENWGSSSNSTWSDAVHACNIKVFAERRGWRLPTISELSSVFNPPVGNLPPIFNVSLSSILTWSATTYPFDINQAYAARQGTATNVRILARAQSLATTWCVRGPAGANSN